MLTIEDLHKEDLLRDFEVLKSYEKILECCQEEIQYVHRYNRKDKMLFNVPRGIPDESEYDFVSCVNYIIKALRVAGFYVRFIRPHYVYISWTNSKIVERKFKELKILIKEDYETHKAFGLVKQKSIGGKKIVYKKIKLIKQ